ncbi:MAG TPA: acetyltransferase [Burkholderiales bacterium]|nr:acetyltransferase [Burkholderiales bacterium]
MKFIDVFNGDADGICALHQLRLAQPRQAQLVTGVKRDIALLDRVEANAGDELTVLDISMEQNQRPLHALLEAGAKLRWFDHHRPGAIPSHSGLDAHIDTSADTCTSLIVNRWLEDKHLVWAVTAAFGDNLHNAAHAAAASLHLSATELDSLRELGEAINYNAYGESIDDLHFDPALLYGRLHEYVDPFNFIHEAPEFTVLRDGFQQDMRLAEDLKPEIAEPWGAVYTLPSCSWARRVSGVWANDLAQNAPDRAHAVLTKNNEGYVVSVRAPLNRRGGADELCVQFEGGGGRKAAAGINHLSESDLGRFISAFGKVFGANA